MKILVAVSSQHGSSREIGAAIARELEQRGHSVTFTDPASVHGIEQYDAVVVGSAVYMTQWMESAREFTKRFASTLREVPLWAFSVGLSGVLKGSINDPARIGPVLLSIAPIEHKTFPGRLDPSRLGLRERTIARLGGAIEGDYRNFAEVAAWAQKIADYLDKHAK